MAPSLTRHDPVDAPSAVVLLLHGGKPNSQSPVDARSLSWQRMAAMHRALSRTWMNEGIASCLLRYHHQGWNDGARVADARWALDEVRDSYGEIPVVLLGHSMGGRVAVHVADDRSVMGVTALAPWWEPSDPVATLGGRTLLAAHARRDRITSMQRTSMYVDRARALGVPAELVDMGWHGHYMLTGIRQWNRAASRGVQTSLTMTHCRESGH